MARIVLSDIVSGYLTVDKLNTTLAAIETAFDRVVFRDGTAPNAMTADFDLGGHKILNMGNDPDDPDSVPTFFTMQQYIDLRASGLVVQKYERQIASAGQQVFNLTQMTYTKNTNNISVHVNGVRKFVGYDFVETSPSSITMNSGLSSGDKVDFVTNSYLATASLPTHQHTWTDITNVPVYTTRWPVWEEVSGKPATFSPDLHNHDAGQIITGQLADFQRGLFVQATQPASVGTVGAIWMW